MIHLSPIIGEKKSRVIKKIIFYIGAVLISYVITSIGYTSITIIRLCATTSKTFVHDWELSGWVAVILLLVLLYAPVILWTVFRANYKYASMQGALDEEKRTNGNLWDILSGGRSTHLEEISRTVVRDDGEFGRAEGTYTREDVNRAIMDREEIEEFA